MIEFDSCAVSVVKLKRQNRIIDGNNTINKTEGGIKLKRIACFLLLVGMGMVLSSCACPLTTSTPWPYPSESPAIQTSVVKLEVKGDKKETLTISLTDKGTCENIEVTYEDGEKEGFTINCINREEFLNKTISLEDSYFCVKAKIPGLPPEFRKNPNASIVFAEKNEVGGLYCGNIRFLTDGTDVKFKPEMEQKNYKCKYQSGRYTCY